MLKYIKRYALADDITIDTLILKGFKLDEKNIAYNTSISLYNDIEVNVDIIINADGTLSFNDLDNVLVFDNRFNQPYTPFYENKLFHFLEFIIFRYNEFMDSLVEKGILVIQDNELENNPKRTLEKDKRTI